jgi:uncharacterized protein (DUF1330 family)
MPAYVVGTIRVVDPSRWQQYLERVGTTFGPHGGTVLFRGRHAEDFNGESHGERIVAIEFPDLDAARRWHASPEYQSLVALRDDGAEVVLSAYEAPPPAG